MSSSLRASSDSSAPAPTSGRRVAEFGDQQLDPVRLGQRRVVGMHARPRQQLGDHLLVHVGVLPHVEAGQVKPEDAHRFPQPGQPIVGQHRAAVGAQRRVDDIEVGQQLGRRHVALEAEVEFVFGLTVEDLGRGRGKPAVDHPQRAPVRLVGAGGLVARIGQRGQLVADLHQPRRHRQFLLERGDFDEVVRQRGVRGAAGGQPDHVGGDVGVAVTVTADPRAGPQDRLARAGARPASAPAARPAPRR